MFQRISISLLIAGTQFFTHVEGVPDPFSSLGDAAHRVLPAVVPLCSSDETDATMLSIKGTGFLISRDGLIATASHLPSEASLSTFIKGSWWPCSVVARQFSVNADNPNPTQRVVWDVAVLRVAADVSDCSPVFLSTRESFRIGEPVATLGYFDEGTTERIGSTSYTKPLLTLGTIGAVFGITLPKRYLGTRLALDITAGPGSSGSPVFDPATGDVIGIISKAKMRTVLSPKGVLERIPLGIVHTEPVFQLANWLREKK